MGRKIIGFIIIGLIVVASLAIITPAQATFTLGDLVGVYPFHGEDFDPHVPGVIGYVWPGGGLNSYAGAPNFATNELYPGYQSPYPCTLAFQRPPNQCSPPGAPSSSWYQLEENTYAPFGAILAGSTGDLIFALNATAGLTCPTLTNPSQSCSWDTLAILLPPGFTVPDPSQIISTITNNYSGISVVKIGPFDRYAPGWTMVEVYTDLGTDSANPNPSPNVAQRYYNHQAINFTSAGEWYYVRINGVVAPSIAGRYFFKILLFGTSETICGEEGTGPFATPPITAGGLPGESCSQFIPTQNWPVLLVKGEIDPAIVTGTVRYGGYNSTLYGQAIGEAGQVYAHMETKLDPYTGQQITTCPALGAIGVASVPGCTDAVGYFNHTATGHYEVEGVAPGIYTLYAEAAGFPQSVCASDVTVLKGQSLHFDCYLQPGPVIHGNVFTKHQYGDEPWMGELPSCITSPSSFPACSYDTYNEYIKIEFYDAPTLNNLPDPSAKMVSWSPVPCVAGGQQRFYGRQDAGFCDDPRLAAEIAFPWHEYVERNGYGAPGIPFIQVSAGNTMGTLSNDAFQDPMGVGPPQHWFVQGGTTIPFHFEFGVKGEYGAPRDLDGMVPQVYATWVNGLTPGRYYARAWVFRYVQTALDGATFQEYYFDITPQEWAGDVTLPIDLRLSSWVNKTVHFHDEINSIGEDPIDTGAGLMSGVLVDSNGVVWSYNQSLLGYQGTNCVPAGSCGYTVGVRSGWGAAAFYCPLPLADVSLVHLLPCPATLRHRNDLDKAQLNAYAIETGRANIQFWGWNDTWGGENYGIPSGTYTPVVFVLGYIEQGPLSQVSVTLSGTMTSVSDHMYRGAGLNITAYSIDWERPTVNRNWVWGNPVGYTVSGSVRVSEGSGPSFPGDPRCPNALSPPGLGCMVGEEIDVGVYQNGTLIDFIGDEISNLQDTVLTSCLFQSQTNSSVQMCGGGWDPQQSNPSLGPYQGNANDAYFGQELKHIGQVGGYLAGLLYFETPTELFGPSHYSPTELPDGSIYSTAAQGFTNLYPTAIAPGEYELRGYTYGYIQDQTFSAYTGLTQVADVRLNLVIGVNVTLDILFKKEHVITGTPDNMSARVRLFDDSGNLVAEWMSSEGTYVGSTSTSLPGTLPIYQSTSGRAVAADGTDQYPFGPLQPAVPEPNPINGYNYVPGGVTLLHVLMAGLPQVPAAGTDDSPIGAPGVGVEYTENTFIPQQAYMNDPVMATTTCGFELDCYTSPGVSMGVGVPGYFANTGILGYPDYQGGWTAEVDFVPWYNNNTATPQPGNSLRFPTVGAQTPSEGIPVSPIAFAQYYTPVPGLLLGESYHVIPGTTALSGISLTEDLALNPSLLAHSLAPNHLGPYSQEGVWQISGTHLSGEASGIFEVDLNGFISGIALAFTWVNDFRPLSWATVAVTGARSVSGVAYSESWNYYTYDGEYQMYLPAGSYSLTIASPGIASQTLSIAVTGGELGTAGNVYMQQSNIPVPEFNGLAVVTFSALAASLYILRRKRK